MTRSIRLSLAASAAMLIAVPAYAQDQCGDILTSGVFDTVDTSSRSEYREIIVSRFISSDYASSKQASSGIGGKSIGQLVMGSAYTESQYNQKKASLQQSYDRTLTKTDEWALATRTANPTIVAAWEKCMGNRSGLIARFETQPGDGQNVTLVLTVNGAMGVNQVKVAGNTTIPTGAQLLSQNQYNRCLRNNAVIHATAPCRVALRVPSAQPIKIIVSTPQGDAEAYLGKRLRWSYATRPFTITRDVEVTANESSDHSNSASIPPSDLLEGYTIVPASVRVTGPSRIYGSGDGYCTQLSYDVTPISISYKYLIHATDNMSTGCRLIFTGMLELGKFVPED